MVTYDPTARVYDVGTAAIRHRRGKRADAHTALVALLNRGIGA